MELKSRSNIVILASAHNPSIINPQWLKDKNLIKEDPTNFASTPEFSVFESETYSLLVDRNRLQIAIKNDEDNSLNFLPKIASTYIELLPHIPYKSIGFNFDWFYDKSNKKNILEYNIKIGNSIGLSNILDDYKINYGGIIHAEGKNHNLKLILEPPSETLQKFNFNYHHDIQDLNVKDMVEVVGNFLNVHKHSKEVVTSIIEMEFDDE